MSSFDVNIEIESVSSEVVGENDFSHQTGFERSDESNIGIRKTQFSAQVFETRKGSDNRKENRLSGVVLLRNYLDRDRESGLGE